MFKKGPDIDKKKLLLKASDVKKDSLTRLKHFKTLIEHLDYNELPLLFRSHFSFIYHTFIDTFSTFDCNSKQRRDDLDCILFMLEKILIYNPELIKKRWQFYSITFVMQKLLHRNNTWQLRNEGVRLFVIWYQILCDETNPELQTMFGSLVPGLVPQSSLPISSPTTPSIVQATNQHSNPGSPQLPIKLCSIDPLVPMSANEQLPNDEVSFYLDSLLQYMVTQTTKPFWTPQEEGKKNQILGFSFMFNMFGKIYLPHIFMNFKPFFDPSSESYFLNHSINQYVDEVSDTYQYRNQNNGDYNSSSSSSSPAVSASKRDPLHIDLKQSNFLTPISQSNNDYERSVTLSVYQAIVIRWLTRILRQDMILGQDELIRGSGSAERQNQNNRESSSGPDQEYSFATDGNSTTIFHGVETSSTEMEIARQVIGTWSANIAIVHELFRRAFLNYYQPASMKRVVNVYKEWICNGPPSQANTQGRNSRLGYSSFSDLLQTFVVNSSSAFVTRVHNPTMLDEQVEMCKRIMNIYRYMVMKIFMNTSTWEQLLNVMLSITEQLFPSIPPEKKENTIGGRIAPAFFQTFIVSWIRANLYVHISSQMWNEFHRVMKNLVRWRELIEEWSTTMGSLTRVLVKHVYGLSLTDLPLDRPQERRRRPRALKSFSTAEGVAGKKSEPPSPNQSGPEAVKQAQNDQDQSLRSTRSGSVRLPGYKNLSKGIIRSNSDGALNHNAKLYYSSLRDEDLVTGKKMRKIKSEYLVFDSGIAVSSGHRPDLRAHNDVIDGTSLKDSNMIIEHDQALESHHSGKSGDISKSNKKLDSRQNSDKCVLLGGSVRGWTRENSVIMWRRMLGLFGNINSIEDPDNHIVAMSCLATMLCDFVKARDNLGISLDNQSTPGQPSLIPPYAYQVAWLLEATHLPRQFKESRLIAYKLLCKMTIRRHDIELSQNYYTAFYEALQRGLTSPDPMVHASIIKNCNQILSLELPGCTFLVQGLYERSRSILLTNQKETSPANSPRDQAVQVLNTIMALNRPIKKLMVLKPELNNPMNLVAPGDIKTKIFDTFLACNLRPIVLDVQTRSKSLCAMTIHVYQELHDKSDSLDVEKLFDTLMTELQDPNNNNLFRMNCDMLRLFADHAASLAHTRPALVSSVIQIVCQLIVRLSTDENNKESIHFLLICLEDWCLAVGKSYLVKPVGQLSTEDDDTLSTSLNESLITIVLRSLENVIHDEQFIDDSSNKGTRGSIMSTSKGSDAQSSGHHSHLGSRSSDNGLVGPRDRTITNENSNNSQHQQRQHQQQDDSNMAHGNIMTNENKNLNPIKLACKISHHKLVTYLGHFPLRQVGPASMSCCVNESDYLSYEQQELSDLKNTSGVFLLVIDGTTIVSFIGSPMNNNGIFQPVHLIVRNLCGKYSWDASCIEMEAVNRNNEPDLIVIDPESFQEISRGSMKYDSDFNEDGNSTSSLSSRSSANRDCIGDLLNQLSISMASSNGSSSISSSSQNMHKKRNCAQSVSNPRFKIAQAEETMIALLTNQRFQELNYCERSDDLDKVVLNFKGRYNEKGSLSCGKTTTTANDQLDRSLTMHDVCQTQIISFEQCRQLVQQLGYLSWEKRCKIDSLAKSPRLLRELKNLDGQSGRETHKMAVIYVANGQEDKNSILTNSHGSRAFEDFVAGLGWEVNLASHLGFKGGLQTNKSTGETSPYYCNGTTEIMFHVSTRIPINGPADDESLNKKLRHLGNDEIHIIWSEHSRDYRRGIIPTEFGDVIIAIYPMLTFQGYFRVQISSKQDVPMFGPLFDNCIVHQTCLASLVRATAINASRAKRLKLPYYQSHFEERNRLIETIVQNHKEKLSFEEFSVQLYSKSELRGPPATPTGSGSIQEPAACCS